MIMLHGRGSSAESILSLVRNSITRSSPISRRRLPGTRGIPIGFMEPLERNEPYLSSALGVIARLVAQVMRRAFRRHKIVLLGFSQGACLTLEFAARHATRYGGVVGLSGGLIGADDTPRDYPGSFDGTPVFLGCSDVDFHIPKARVDQSADGLRADGRDGHRAAVSAHGAYHQSRTRSTSSRR